MVNRSQMPTLHTRPSETGSRPPLCIRLGLVVVRNHRKILFSRLAKRRLAISDNVWLIGEDKTLNPKQVKQATALPSDVLKITVNSLKYFIIIPALFGNGQSSSPSNQESDKPFPKVSFFDNVRAQHELVTKHLKIEHLHAVLGWSMGAGQVGPSARVY